LTEAWLLDVNVLLAWLWPSHEAHRSAIGWMKNTPIDSWITCPITEMGFLRIVTNPSYSPIAPRWSEAVALLNKQIEDDPRHRFLPDSLAVFSIDQRFGARIQGPGQITDAYLLALAMHNRARMVTFDYRIAAIAPEGSPEAESLLILRP